MVNEKIFLVCVTKFFFFFMCNKLFSYWKLCSIGKVYICTDRNLMISKVSTKFDHIESSRPRKMS